MKLTDNEKRDIIKYLEKNKPLPIDNIYQKRYLTPFSLFRTFFAPFSFIIIKKEKTLNQQKKTTHSSCVLTGFLVILNLRRRV
jgi:hypothetical protein